MITTHWNFEKETGKTADRMDQSKRLFTLQTIPSSLQLYVWRHKYQQHDESKLSFLLLLLMLNWRNLETFDPFYLQIDEFISLSLFKMNSTLLKSIFLLKPVKKY